MLWSMQTEVDDGGWRNDQSTTAIQREADAQFEATKKKEMTEMVTELAGTVRERELELSAQQW